MRRSRDHDNREVETRVERVPIAQNCVRNTEQLFNEPHCRRVVRPLGRRARELWEWAMHREQARRGDHPKANSAGVQFRVDNVDPDCRRPRGTPSTAVSGS